MQVHFYIVFIAAIIPLLVGFVWYNPKVFGTAWMKSIKVTEESLQGGNMALIFGLCYVFACMIAMAMMPLVIHQFGFNSVFQGDTSSESAAYVKSFFENYGGRFRTFKHGAFHGVISAIFIALPILGTNALFERRGFKYIAIHTGYWIVTLALMGGVICQFM